MLKRFQKAFLLSKSLLGHILKELSITKNLTQIQTLSKASSSRVPKQLIDSLLIGHTCLWLVYDFQFVVTVSHLTWKGPNNNLFLYIEIKLSRKLYIFKYNKFIKSDILGTHAHTAICLTFNFIFLPSKLCESIHVDWSSSKYIASLQHVRRTFLSLLEHRTRMKLPRLSMSVQPPQSWLINWHVWIAHQQVTVPT